MKIRSSTLGILSLLAALSVWGQGTFVFDQQSSTDETPFTGGMQIPAYPDYGSGQSFTPASSSVAFIRLLLNDRNTSDSAGALVYVNVRSSISGGVLGTSTSVQMLNGFSGPETFLFGVPVPVTPGSSYYFEVVEQTGGPWNVQVGQYNYPGGTAFLAGSPNIPQDFWFREGVIVPEPSSAITMLFGGTAILLLRYRNRK